MGREGPERPWGSRNQPKDSAYRNVVLCRCSFCRYLELSVPQTYRAVVNRPVAWLQELCGHEQCCDGVCPVTVGGSLLRAYGRELFL